MKRTAALGLVAMVIALSACRASSAPADPRTPAGPGVCRPGASTVCLTAASGGHSVTVRTGWTVGVELRASALVWSGLSLTGAGVLVARAGVTEADGVIAARYRAAKAGHAELRALGRPRCRVGQACPQYVVLWQVRVSVVT